jgi:hypothetical protein
MDRSPDPESTSTSASPPSSSGCARQRASPRIFSSTCRSPVADVIGKGRSSPFPSYPIVIPTVRRPVPSPDTRHSINPVSSRVAVITTGRRGDTSAAIPSSHGRDISPSSPDRLVRCDSPSEDFVRMHHPVHVTDVKSCREATYAGRTICAADGRSDGPPPVSDSRQLKFGMERILSADMSPAIRRHQHQG